MSLTQEEWTEIIQHIRTRVREVGLGELDDRVVRDFRGTQDPKTNFVRYLNQFIQALSESSGSTYKRTLSVLDASVRAESGSRIHGIEVAVSDSDVSILGSNSIDLGFSGRYDDLIDKLKKLRQDMHQAGLISE